MHGEDQPIIVVYTDLAHLLHDADMRMALAAKARRELLVPRMWLEKVTWKVRFRLGELLLCGFCRQALGRAAGSSRKPSQITHASAVFRFLIEQTPRIYQDSTMCAHGYSGWPSRPCSTTAQHVPGGRAALLWKLRTIFRHVQSSIKSAGFPLPTVLHHLRKNRSRRIQLDIRRCEAPCQVEPVAHLDT